MVFGGKAQYIHTPRTLSTQLNRRNLIEKLTLVEQKIFCVNSIYFISENPTETEKIQTQPAKNEIFLTEQKTLRSVVIGANKMYLQNLDVLKPNDALIFN